MGSGTDAVLDPRLRVRGVANLRVADASVMPTVLSANLNCSSMMIGHHAVSAGPAGNLDPHAVTTSLVVRRRS